MIDSVSGITMSELTKPEKTQAEIHEKVGRIARQLGNRAAKLQDAIVATNTRDNRIVLDVRESIGGPATNIEHSKKVTTEDGTKSILTQVNPHSVVRHTVDSQQFKGVEVGRATIATEGGPVISDKPSQRAFVMPVDANEHIISVNRDDISLTNEQAIQASAGILSQTRNELVMRQRAHESAQEQKAAGIVNDILKA